MLPFEPLLRCHGVETAGAEAGGGGAGKTDWRHQGCDAIVAALQAVEASDRLLQGKPPLVARLTTRREAFHWEAFPTGEVPSIAFEWEAFHWTRPTHQAAHPPVSAVRAMSSPGLLGCPHIHAAAWRSMGWRVAMVTSGGWHSQTEHW